MSLISLSVLVEFTVLTYKTLDIIIRYPVALAVQHVFLFVWFGFFQYSLPCMREVVGKRCMCRAGLVFRQVPLAEIFIKGHVARC